jgi:ABC-type polysaccharide/polyol phosphate transport system ATPase subunit
MQPIIEVHNVSKQYRLGRVGTGSVSHDINRWWYRIRGKEDPYLKIGETNDRSTKGESDYVWALRDISFSVQPGEVLGIIGRNGAGKSTLLKILSRITTPTTGSIRLGGRVASLLEVGTGMHPELTGRENIYLNGAILGMRRKEIDLKLDAIIDFAGVTRYVDTPVKRYSSGMHVRLAFAVAAHLEPDILIVDEVLAVGDMEFQKKCIGKMKEVSNKEGRTVLFVSHNMEAIQKLCERCLLLHESKIHTVGTVQSCIQQYLSFENNKKVYVKKKSDKPCYVRKIIFNDNKGEILEIAEPWEVEVEVEVKEPLNDFRCALGLTAMNGHPIHTTWSVPMHLDSGIFTFSFQSDNIILAASVFNISIGISSKMNTIEFLENILQFSISERKDGEKVALVQTGSSGLILNQMKTLVKKNEHVF